MLLSNAYKRWRARASAAYRSAVTSHYPDIFAKDAERFEKIPARGSIRTEANFYLVRHQIDEAEGAGQHAFLRELYGLVQAYEVRGA